MAASFIGRLRVSARPALDALRPLPIALPVLRSFGPPAARQAVAVVPKRARKARANVAAELKP